MSDIKEIPKHLGTARQFKARKRREMRTARQAVDALGIGCAYLPEEAFHAVVQARAAIERANEVCREWWRKA